MAHKGRRKIQPSPRKQKPSLQAEVIPSSEYPVDIKDALCTRILDGEKLHVMCKEDGMPAQPTVLRWLNDDPAFMERFINAQRARALLDADMMQYIADGNTRIEVEKVVTDKDGEASTVVMSIPEDVQRSALRVKTIQWRASKLIPNIFGDKVQQEHSIVGDLAALINGASNKGHRLPEREQ